LRAQEVGSLGRHSDDPYERLRLRKELILSSRPHGAGQVCEQGIECRRDGGRVCAEVSMSAAEAPWTVRAA
jgi:hypothetical protein